MKVAVLDLNGKDTGRKADLSKDVFAIEPNNHAVYLDSSNILQTNVKERISQKSELRFREVS